MSKDGLSSGFDSPKVKPPLEAVFSVLEDAVPNTGPPPAPNLNPEFGAGWSDFFSSLEAVPNLKPSVELPNLNPEEGAVSFEVVSDEEPPLGAPNLNPPDEEEDNSDEPPNLKPPDSEPEVLSVVPNLNPPVPEPEELFDKPNLKPPDPEPGVLSDVPNLNPPELGVLEPNAEEAEVPPERKAKKKRNVRSLKHYNLN